MTWVTRVEKSINEIKGVRCDQIYSVGNHFTVPIRISPEAFVKSSTSKILSLVQAKIIQEIPAKYTYEVACNISTKS